MSGAWTLNLSDNKTERYMSDTSSPENVTPADMAKKLDPEEVATVMALQRQSQEIVQQIGQGEVRKHRMLGALADIEERAQGIMNAAASRLGIPPGTPWRMSPDGTVVVLPPTP